MTDQMSIAEFKQLGKRREPPKALTNFKQFLQEGGFGRMVCEFQYHPVRRWKFDFAFPDHVPPIAFEYEGITYSTAFNKAKLDVGDSNVGHASTRNIMRDIERINAAQELGWVVYRVHAKSVGSGEAYSLARRVLEGNS